MSIFNHSVSSWANSDGEVGRHHANTSLHALKATTWPETHMWMQRGCAWWTFGDIVWFVMRANWSALKALDSNHRVARCDRRRRRP